MVLSAHAEFVPVSTWVRVTPESTPDAATATGTLLWVLVPFPSWPLPFAPQQYAAPVLLSAQVKPVPVEIWVRVTPDSAPPGYTATAPLLLIVELVPSWPVALLP